MTLQTVVLRVPMPPARNKVEGAHFQKLARLKNAYRQLVWNAALESGQLKHADQLQELRTVSLTWSIGQELPHDQDAWDYAGKWVLDALKQKQRGKMRWRQGLGDQKGLLLDDSPSYCRWLGTKVYDDPLDGDAPHGTVVISWWPGEVDPHV